MISDSIRASKLKLIVFIDDLDRLNSEETLSVLALIRNSFNFPNTFFFVAYDHTYVLKILKQQKIASPDQFLEKIFQFEIGLPSYPTEILKYQLLTLLSTGKSEQDIADLAITFTSLEARIRISELFQNLRECVRYANCINLLYGKKRPEIDLTDFIVLELIKHKDAGVHQQLRTSLMSNSQSDYIISVNEEMSNGYLKFETEKFTGKGKVVTALMDYLFNRENVDLARSIRTPGNGVRYFSDHLFGTISFSEFDIYKKVNSPEPFKQFITQCLSEGKLPALKQIFTSVYDFSDQASLNNFCRGLILFMHSDDGTELPRHCFDVLGRHSNNTKIFSSKQEFDQYLLLLLKADVFPSPEYSVALEFIRSNDFVGNVDVNLNELLIGLTTDLLAKEITDDTQLNMNWVQLYRQLPIHYFTKNEELIKRIHANVQVHSPTFLMEFTYRKDGDMWALENYLPDILGWSFFENLLDSVPETFRILQLKSFYKSYKNNNYEAIQRQFNTLSIVSDKVTLTDRGFPAVNTNRAFKYALSNRYRIFNNAEWIAHTANITSNEAIKGGSYSFIRSINISSIGIKINSAIFHFMVDDDLMLNINGQLVFTSYSKLEQKEPFTVDVTKYIIHGVNRFEFKVQNIPYDKEIIQKNPDANPYEFIYNLVIEFDNAGRM